MFSRYIRVAIMLVGATPVAAQSTPVLSPAHPKVLVVAYGFPRGAEERAAANEVRTMLDTARAGGYMSVVAAKFVSLVETAAGISAIRNPDELKAFARQVNADVGIGVTRVIGRNGTRLAATLIYVTDSGPAVPRLFAEDTSLVLAARSLGRSIAADSMLLHRRCCP